MPRVAVVSLVLSLSLMQYLVAPASRDPTVLKPQVIPPKNLEHMVFGYRETVADSLWLRVIQNFGYCSTDPGTPRADRSLVKGEDPLDQLEKLVIEERCKEGWVYQMLDRITDLEPRFLSAYTMGASTLSILVDDDVGASALYAKGVKAFPEHWSLAYRAAYHELYERKNYELAAVYLSQAAQNGAPVWVHNLASKLYERTGQLLLGRLALIDLIRRVGDNVELKNKAEKRLEKLNRLWEEEQRRKEKNKEIK